MPSLSLIAHPADTSDFEPAFRGHPSRLFVETTSRCNLNCTVCVRQSHYGANPVGDMELSTFEALKDAFPYLDALVLNGIGEPLLNQHLEQFISRAKKNMPWKSWIGFQTNGNLLTNLRALSLVNAGLDRICLSMDSASPSAFSVIRGGGQLFDLEQAFSAIVSAKAICFRPDLQVGVEYAVMRDNLAELPDALRWAASRGANFAVVTRLHPFDEAHFEQCAFDSHPEESRIFFNVWKLKADLAGVDINRYFELLWKYGRTHEEQRTVNFVESMRAVARRRGIHLDLKRFFSKDYLKVDELDAVFERARQVAQETGINLSLPELESRERRGCNFIEQGSAFISWEGRVHPCYQLWHQCRSYANARLSPARPRVFGNILEEGVLDIWNREDFRAYRRNVLHYNFPVCAGCRCSPCDNAGNEMLEQNFKVDFEPHGGCLWSSGVFRCLD